MNSDDSVDDAIHFILNAVNKENLHLLLSKDEDWELFVANTEITRDELNALHEALKKQGMLSDAEVEEMHQKEKEFRERFLALYPQVKRESEERIEQLRALADRADQVHKNCTITNVVANSTGLTAGILTLVGIGLTPFTTGLSLPLSATGLALGTAAATTTVISSIVEHKEVSSIEAEAKTLESTGVSFHMLLEVLGDNKRRISSVVNSYKVVREILRHVHAIDLARLSPEVAAQSSSLIGKLFGGSAQIMTMGARVFVGAATGFAVLVDIYSLVQDSRDLQEGAKSKAGEKLRQRAQELENMSMALKHIHERLKQGLSPSE